MGSEEGSERKGRRKRKREGKKKRRKAHVDEDAFEAELEAAAEGLTDWRTALGPIADAAVAEGEGEQEAQAEPEAVEAAAEGWEAVKMRKTQRLAALAAQYVSSSRDSRGAAG